MNSIFRKSKPMFQEERHEPKAKSKKSNSMVNLRKALSASFDSFSKAVINGFDFKSKNRASTQDTFTEKPGLAEETILGMKNLLKRPKSDARNFNIPFGKIQLIQAFAEKETDYRNIQDAIDSVTPQMMAKPKAKNFALQSQFKQQESTTTLSTELSTSMGLNFALPEKKSVPLPAFNTPAQDQNEEEMRKKLLADLLNGSDPLNPKFSERYVLGDLLGDGAFGFVFTATKLDENVEVAVKFIIRSKIAADGWVAVGSEKVPTEVAILMKLKHPNVIRFIEYIIVPDFVLLITELHGTSWDASNLELDPINNPGLKFKFREKTIEAEGSTVRSRTSCDLFECIDAHSIIPNAKAKFLFAQIVLACDYLQECGLVHRDIKDENIVVNAKYEIKLIDFGSASSIPLKKENYFTRYNGTPHFASPEIVRKRPYQGPQAEVWTLGVLLYTIVFGENPFNGSKDILAYGGRLNYPRYIESELKRLIEGMLCIDYKRRYTLDQIKSHPWCALQIAQLKRQYE